MVNTMRQLKGTLILLGILLLGGCASGPKYPTEGVELAVTPLQAVSEAAALRGKTVLWGGVIIASSNLRDQSRLEILAYPLDGNQYPQTDSPPLGRFLLLMDGYVETIDYAPGRQVTARGPLTGTEGGKVGDTDYTYPVVKTQDIHLWPRAGRSDPRIHFGVGVVFGR